MSSKIDMELYLKLKEWSQGKTKWHDIEYEWIPTMAELIVQMIEDLYRLEVKEDGD
jgi:hypothetical protein